MILYTVVPPDAVLESGPDAGAFADLIEVNVPEMRLLVSPVGHGVGRIVKLVAAPLHCYLRPELTPGSLIAFRTGSSANHGSTVI